MKNFQFFISAEAIKEGNIVITGELFHKIKNVLRYKKGDEIILLLSHDKKHCGKRYYGKVSGISDKRLDIKIIREKEVTPPVIFTTLYLSLIKSKNFEAAIQKATELGVNKIVPLMAQRSVVKIKKEGTEKKKIRWESIAAEAACQCKRDDVPVIADIIYPSDLKNIRDAAGIKIVCDENSGFFLRDHLKQFDTPLSISAAVGPEGGFTKEETETFNGLGFKPVLLANNVLRSETVPIFLMSVIKYEFDNRP
jgi:16S rRNA (uracil1498-N3)-methyltransferase